MDSKFLKVMGSNLLVLRGVEMDTEVDREEEDLVEREDKGEEVSEVVAVKVEVVATEEEEGVLEVDVDVVSSSSYLSSPPN